MSSGQQLVDLVRAVRAEAGHSLNEAHGQSQRETIVYLLQRKQRQLWRAHDWPLYKVERDLEFTAGTRYLNYPDDVEPERVNKIERFWSQRYERLVYGISGKEYNAYDSDRDQRTWPLRNWDHYYVPGMQAGQLGQIEIWPIPSEDGRIRVYGHMRLQPFIDDDDLCTLDGDMLVAYVAGRLLLRQNKSDAQELLREADRMRLDILGESGTARENQSRYGGRNRMPGKSRGIVYVTKRTGT